MADKPTPLRLYNGVAGPVAYDAQGRTWRTDKVGDQQVPRNFQGRYVIVDRFDEAKKK